MEAGARSRALAGVESIVIEASVSAVPLALVRRLVLASGICPTMRPTRKRDAPSASGSPGLLSRRVSRTFELPGLPLSVQH
jgi:hypothetical protein